MTNSVSDEYDRRRIHVDGVSIICFHETSFSCVPKLSLSKRLRLGSNVELLMCRIKC